MRFKVDIHDNNGNVASLAADDQRSIEDLVMYVAAAATTEGHAGIKRDGAVVVRDVDGKEVGRADISTKWLLSMDN